MKRVFIGTKLEETEYRAFGSRAKASGLSKSALLKKLVHDFVVTSPAAIPTPPQGQPEKSAPISLKLTKPEI
jgi:hypothetical protein